MERGIGEQAERGRRLRKIAVIGALFTFGLVSGFFVGHSGRGLEALLGPEPILSPAVAIGLVVLTLAATAIGSLLLKDQMDEVEKLNKYKAGSVAGSVYLLTYMCWFFLWKGGLVPEPMHIVLFLLFLVSFFGGMAHYRYR
ncbi:MAG TPA: hypothetical protein VGB08_04335 [Allosphingosinicella sp.]|jgi:drug/metabolite transporter (DMT)-like permease